MVESSRLWQRLFWEYDCSSSHELLWTHTQSYVCLTELERVGWKIEMFGTKLNKHNDVLSLKEFREFPITMFLYWSTINSRIWLWYFWFHERVFPPSISYKFAICAVSLSIPTLFYFIFGYFFHLALSTCLILHFFISAPQSKPEYLHIRSHT